MHKNILLFVAVTVLLGGCQNRAVEPSNDPLERAVLTRADFEYLGSFAPPKAAIANPAGGKWSTGYGFGGIALRRVDNQLRFFATTHVYSGSLVYEMNYPGLSKTDGQWPAASIVREWGDVYQGRKILNTKLGNDECAGEDNTLSGAAWTHGLHWDEQLERLYWSYGNWYNGGHCNNPALGFTTFKNDQITAHGPFTASQGNGEHAQMMRGGTLRIPQWFADRYLGGRNLGVGFGGYYSIIAEGSQGPSLFAINAPSTTDTKLEVKPLLNFPGGKKATRNTDYFLGQDANGNKHPTWDKDPENGTGFYTAADTVEGAAIWLETPTKQGLVYFPRLGHGRIGYDEGSITWQRQKQWWTIYHPKDLVSVTEGRTQAWEVAPASSFEADFALPHLDSRITGAAFDTQEQILYVYVYQVYKDGVELYPLIRAYKVK
jgi:hypothetical protein